MKIKIKSFNYTTSDKKETINERKQQKCCTASKRESFSPDDNIICPIPKKKHLRIFIMILMMMGFMM